MGKLARVWDGSEWVPLVNKESFAYQSTPPTGAQTGDIWVDSDSFVPSIDTAVYYRWRKTVTGGQTSLSGVDDDSLTLQYTPGYEQLFLNGILMVRNVDYAATTGTTITGLTALVANDVVEVLSPQVFTATDVYTQTQSDTKYVSKTTTPAFRLYQSVAQTIATATNTALLFDSTDLDTDNAHSVTTNTSRYTATVAGWYMVTGTLQISHNTTGNRIVFIRKNGSTTINQVGRQTSSVTNTLGLQISTMVYLNGTTDYVELMAFQSSGGNLDTLTANPSYFEGFWVRS